MLKVKVGDINLYYEIHGKGEPLVIIKMAGHHFMIEAFDESNRIMLEFLQRHSTKKA